MCFKNLPIEFDQQGKAYLKEGWEGTQFGSLAKKGTVGDSAKSESPIKLSDPGRAGDGNLGNPGNPGSETGLKEKPGEKEFTIDPVTRVAGALGFHTKCDMQRGCVTEAHSYATLFRGYEVILKGRDPRDAIDISSRACGVCGAVHSTCSSLALEMAFGIKPPPMGVVARNLGETAEFLYDHPLHMFLLAGPDYSEVTLKATNPEIWEKAKKTEAPHGAIHGFKTIGEIMQALNPLTGRLYLEAFETTRLGREMCVLMYGKYPHPSTLVPGGVSTTLTFTSFNEYYVRLIKMFDYSKKVVHLWDDLYDFFYSVNPEYKKIGARPVNFANSGIFDDPDSYDATYVNCDAWGERRWSTPGVVINGELRTTRLQQINIGMEEFIDHSFYDPWVEKEKALPVPTDPAGNVLSPYHMWNKTTKPKPVGRNWAEKYSWATSPRWDRTTVESGCYSRLWITAMALKQPPSTFLKPTGKSMKMLVPKAALPEMELEWKIPNVWNALERNRARAYCVPWMCLIAMENLLRAFELMRKGETKSSTPYEVPKNYRIGVGFWEAGRGWLTHHLVIDKGRIVNYQILTPSTINASPLDPFGNPGAYEESVLNTPILETTSPEEFKGIDIQRAIRSFDPCMPCTTHITAGNKLIVRDVNSCGCSLDD